MTPDRERWNEIKSLIDWCFDNPGSFEAVKMLTLGGTCGSLRTGAVGHGFEKWLSSEASRRGLRVADVSSARKKYDLVIGGARTQCKFLGKGNCDIKPCRRDTSGIRRYKRDDLDVMAVAWRSHERTYFVPSGAMIASDGMVITSFDPMAFSEFLLDWSVFDNWTLADKRKMLFD